MSTPPSTVVPPAPPTTSPLSKDWAWLTSHLIAVVLVLGLVAASVVGAVYFVENLEAKHEAKEASLYSSLSAAQTAQNQALETQLSTDEKNWAVVQSQLLAQNSQLAQAVAQKNQQLAVQVKSDATLDTQDAALRLAQQTQATSGEVTTNTDGVVLDLPVTRRIVTSLDELVVAQSDLSSTQTQLANEVTIASNIQTDDSSQKQLVTGLNTEISDNNKACDAKVAEANAKVKRAGIKGFFEGVAAFGIALLGHSL